MEEHPKELLRLSNLYTYMKIFKRYLLRNLD